jgi:hypothetical protein
LFFIRNCRPLSSAHKWNTVLNEITFSLIANVCVGVCLLVNQNFFSHVVLDYSQIKEQIGFTKVRVGMVFMLSFIMSQHQETHI